GRGFVGVVLVPQQKVGRSERPRPEAVGCRERVNSIVEGRLHQREHPWEVERATRAAEIENPGSLDRVRGAVDDGGRGRRGRGRGGRAFGRALLDAAPAAAHPRIETCGAAGEDGWVVLAQAPTWPTALPERSRAAPKLLTACLDADAAVVTQRPATLA